MGHGAVEKTSFQFSGGGVRPPHSPGFFLSPPQGVGARPEPEIRGPKKGEYKAVSRRRKKSAFGDLSLTQGTPSLLPIRALNESYGDVGARAGLERSDYIPAGF